MPTLSSLLVQRGVAPIRLVEDAIARQVFHGGDLATNLLELGGIAEDALLPVLAESHGLEAGPSGVLPVPPPEVLRVVPAELAARHGMFPLSLDGRLLVVAVSEPLSSTVEDDLGFALDLAIRQVLSTQLRIRQAIAGCYGIPLDRRLLRLHAKIDGEGVGTPSAPPPGRDLLPARMPRGVSIPVPTFASGVPGSERPPARLEALPAPKQPFVESPQDLVNPAFPRSAALPSEAEDAPEPPASTPQSSPGEDSERVEPVPTKPWAPAPGSEPRPPLTVVPAPPQNPSAMPLSNTLQGPPIEQPREVVSARSTVATRALAGVLRDALRDEQAVDKRRGPTWRGAERRRKGPFTATRAEAELEEATVTDEVLEILFAFTHQFFEYAALFVVHGDLAEGREAAGPGADRGVVAGIGVPLDLPSHLSDARTRRVPVIARAATAGLDADLVRDLGRGPRPEPKAAAYLPVAVRTRTVAILYGDDGDSDVQLDGIGDVISFIGLAGAALERIALRRKMGAKAPEMSLKVRVQEGAAALARSLAASAAQAARGSGTTLVVPELKPGPQALLETPPVPVQREPMPTPPPETARSSESFDMPAIEGTARAPSGVGRGASVSTRRGLAPPYEGRAGATLDAPQVEWGLHSSMGETPTPLLRADRRRDGSPTGLGSLPRTPPANATSWDVGPDARPHAARRALPRDERMASSVPPTGTPRDLLARDATGAQRELIQRVIEGGHRGRDAFEELVRSGENTIHAIMARFPGPLRVDRHRARGELPPASQCGPILELVVAIRRPALPFVSSRSSAPDVEMRFWATHTLGELRYPEAATVLVPRLFDDDAPVRRTARRSAAALVGGGAAGAPILKGLEDITRSADEPKVHRLVAIETMGEIRSGSLVPPLLHALEDHSEEVADAARRALLLVTRQDFGKDIARWHDWWADNADRHRIEWLIDALMHEQPGVRRAAGDELKLSTKEYFGYYDDLPKRDRERAQGLYRAWWDREGRSRFI